MRKLHSYSCWIHHCVCTVLEETALLQLLDPSLCVQLTLNSSEETALLQLLDPSLCVQYWRKLHSYSCWMHHCVCTVLKGAVPRSCWIHHCVCTVLKGAVPRSCWIHHCVCTVLKGAVPPQLLDPSLCVQLTLNSSEGTALLQLPDPSLCVYSIGGSCTPSVAGSITVCAVLVEAVLIQLLDPSLCV